MNNVVTRIKSILRCMALSTSAIICSSAAWSASLDDLSPGLKADAECMFHVLKIQVSGIDNVKLGVWDDGHWLHPYVEYRAAPDKRGFRYVVRFIAYPACTPETLGSCGASDGRNYHFSAVLPGITAPGEMPSDWGTSRVARKWKRGCGISADAVYV